MIPPLNYDGITYTPPFIASLAEPIADIYDALDEAGRVHHAVAMKHVLALLMHLAKNTQVTNSLIID